MTRLLRLRLAATFIAAGTLVTTYALRSWWQWTPVFIACALWSWYGCRFAWAAAPTVTATAFTVGAVGGVWLGIPPLYMLLVVTAALAAWDLDGLERRIGARAGEAQAALLKAHLTRLAEAIMAGWAAAGIALMVELRLDFGWIFALGLFLAFSLSRALRLLQNATRPEQEP
jgi:hypothetical protein